MYIKKKKIKKKCTFKCKLAKIELKEKPWFGVAFDMLSVIRLHGQCFYSQYTIHLKKTKIDAYI